MTTTMTISEQLTQAAEIVGGKAWGLDRGKPRIYLPSRRDAKVYISFEDAAYCHTDDVVSGTCGLFGAKLNCFIDDCGQSPNWYRSQKAQMLAGARAAFDAVTWFLFSGNADEAERFADGELQIDDEAASHMINGREGQARAAIGFGG